MQWTVEEQTAIREHAAVLGISTQDYIRQSAASRALDWQREQEAFRAMAQQRGISVEQLLQPGILTDDTA
ncbi:hypothetical protein ACN6K9_001680 [Streptomyces sp. SAS_267]|jgi:uncharacterized protein (DUF1778 family)|uniref:hypothetical protein n=1 Tax=Streptomyces sp. SAS_267 TaxID=3412750 RepID=UPI00403C8523